jgi:hypothetical protein
MYYAAPTIPAFPQARYPLRNFLCTVEKLYVCISYGGDKDCKIGVGTKHQPVAEE